MTVGSVRRCWLVAGACLSVLPTVTILACARPAAAVGSDVPGLGLSRFALTTNGAPLVASGSLAASGGLLLTDQGAATVTGRLDNSPSSHVTAVAVEPGQTLRSLSATSGGPSVPGASAQYPGGPGSSSDSTIGSTQASASSHTASARARAGSTQQAASATERLASNVQGNQLSAVVTSSSGAVSIADVLTIDDVVGVASVRYDGRGHHAAAGITITSARVAGQPVSIDSAGVHALGRPVRPLPGGGPPASVETILAKAGVSVSLLQPVKTTSGSNALADSGALVVHETTADLTSGTTTVSSATDVTFYLGRAQATLADALAEPPVLLNLPPVKVPGEPATPLQGLPDVPGAPAYLGTGPSPGPALAPTVTAPLRLLGREISAVTALAALATWQLLTLGTATLGALTTRQREDSGQSCPCGSPEEVP